MREPIKFRDIEHGDTVELEHDGAVIGFKSDETTAKRLKIAASPWEPHPDSQPRMFKLDWSDLEYGKWFLVDRLRWLHTEDYEGWAA